MRFTRSRTAALVAALLAVGGTVTWTGQAPSFAASTDPDRHVIKVYPVQGDGTWFGSSGGFKNSWSAEADLYDATGKKVYHWKEMHPSGTDYVRWEYAGAEGGGWIDLWIHQSDYQMTPYQHLKLGRNYCYRLVADAYDPEIASVEENPACPFEGNEVPAP